MKFGAREICDVVLKAVENGQKIGNQIYRKGQPIMYFDSLKTSSMEQSSTPVYAQGGKGNTKLVSWDGEKAITYVMEDALISPISLAILAKAGITKPGTKGLSVHTQERIVAEKISGSGQVVLYPKAVKDAKTNSNVKEPDVIYSETSGELSLPIWIGKVMDGDRESYMVTGKYDKAGKYFILTTDPDGDGDANNNDAYALNEGDTYLVDYYVKKSASESADNDSTLITIEPESFDGGNFYLEASTLFRAKNGIDYPAEFIIPNCKPQSAMTFAMASSGDPSTFTFTMDAFPGELAFDPTKKVLAAIQIIDDFEDASNYDYDGLTQF